MKKWGYIILTIFSAPFMLRCANQISPNGGPKDTIPPRFLSSDPDTNQRNFKGKIVTLNFDEFIKLKDQKEIIITPNPGKTVTILAKARSLTIEPKNVWKDSTTYSISFREGIQDITESNITRNLHLAFSTGSVIDSLSISGHVSFALKETIPDRITVAIYQQDTFNIIKHQPEYFTETDKNGYFKIQNLKPGNYRIYAFEDKNKNLKVDTQSEFFGFLSQPIALIKNTDLVNIYLIRVDSRPLRLNNLRHNIKLSTLRLSKSVGRYSITYPGLQKYTTTFGTDKTEILIYHPDPIQDSVATRLTATDSVQQKLDTTFYIKTNPTKAVKETFLLKLLPADLNIETGFITSGISFNLPLKSIQADTSIINIDSAFSIKISPQDFNTDTINNIATFTCPMDIKMIKNLYAPPQLYISKAVFISIENDSSKRLTTQVNYQKAEDLATFSINIKTKEPNYIIELVTSDYKIVRSVRNVQTITFHNLPAQEYKLRAIIDRNANGTWDPGSIIKGIEPERMIYYRNADKKYGTPLRANWEVGPYTFSF